MPVKLAYIANLEVLWVQWT